MSIMRRKLFFSVICGLMMAASVSAQQIPSARYNPSNDRASQRSGPTTELGSFDYDTQMWAPVDFSEISERRMNTGFFLTYDRVYMSIGRPDPIGFTASSQVPRGSDWQWGNRYYGGFMGENDKGFQAEYVSVGGMFLSGGVDIQVPDPFVTDTQFDKFEFNRIFREKLSNGSYLEPYFGMAYTSVSDNTIEDTTFFLGTVEIPNRFKQSVRNSAFGGQVGARYITQRGRWSIRTDGSLSASYNSQSYNANDIQVRPGQTFPAVFDTTTTNTSFMPTMDLQLELAYNISRDISVRTSFEILYMWDGVARANTATTGLNPNSVLSTGPRSQAGLADQDFFSGGLGFGIEWKR